MNKDNQCQYRSAETIIYAISDNDRNRSAIQVLTLASQLLFYRESPPPQCMQRNAWRLYDESL